MESLKVYIAVEAKNWPWEGYEFPVIRGLYYDRENAEKDFPQPDEFDDRYDTDNWVHILGPYTLRNRNERD